MKVNPIAPYIDVKKKLETIIGMIALIICLTIMLIFDSPINIDESTKSRFTIDNVIERKVLAPNAHPVITSIIIVGK